MVKLQKTAGMKWLLAVLLIAPSAIAQTQKIPHGEIVWDTTKPDGTPRKLLNISRLAALGWKARIPLEDGMRDAYHGWRKQVG